MKTVEIMGGLGNQLFQVCTLISYAMDNNDEFFFEDKDFKRGEKITTYFDTILQELKKYRREDKINDIFKEKLFSYEKIPPGKNIKLLGYFQSYKYFENNMKNILDLLKIDKLRENYKDKYDYDKTISLHFRIGDYKDVQTYHPVLTIDYYIKCLNTLIKSTNKDDWKILYFYEKNDEDIIRKNINMLQEFFSNLVFIPINHDLDDWEQLLCMSLCTHNIISNSSFSWWGAYLNNDNVVYYPSKWFGPTSIEEDNSKKESIDLIPNKWNKIDVNISLSGYYINLKYREDRNNHIINNVLNKDIFKKITRFEAIKTDNGSLGCALSHINALSQLKVRSERYFLILEDDFEIINENIMNNFKRDLEDFLLSEVEWDLINLTPYNTKVKKDAKSINNFLKTEWTQTTSGYILNRNSIDKLVDLWVISVEAFQNSTNMEKSIEAYSIDQKWNSLENIYVYNSNFAGQLMDYSDISNIDLTKNTIHARAKRMIHKIFYI